MRTIIVCAYKPIYAPRTFEAFHSDDATRKTLVSVLGRAWWSELDGYCIEMLHAAGYELDIMEAWPWQSYG